MAKKAAETLTPVTLELGGKCPAIIFDDADMMVAARRVIWGKVVNAGQTCVAPDYVLLSKQIENKFIESVKAVLKEFYPTVDTGSTSDQQSPNQYSKIVNERQFNRLKDLLRSTKGEIINLDLNHPDLQESDSSLKLPLTLIRNLEEDDVIMKDEIFGPILPILTYEDSESGLLKKLDQIQSTSPLSVYAFSKNEKRLEFVRNHTKSGQFSCNDLLIQFIIPGLPFGGIGSSGIGNYHGYQSFLTFTYERASFNLPFWADFLLKTRYPPYTSFKSKLSQLLLGPKKLSGQSQPNPPKITKSEIKDYKSLFQQDRDGSVKKRLLQLSGAVLLLYWFIARRFRVFDDGSTNRLDRLFELIAKVKETFYRSKA